MIKHTLVGCSRLNLFFFFQTYLPLVQPDFSFLCDSFVHRYLFPFPVSKDLWYAWRWMMSSLEVLSLLFFLPFFFPCSLEHTGVPIFKIPPPFLRVRLSCRPQPPPLWRDTLHPPRLLPSLLRSCRKSAFRRGFTLVPPQSRPLSPFTWYFWFCGISISLPLVYRILFLFPPPWTFPSPFFLASIVPLSFWTDGFSVVGVPEGNRSGFLSMVPLLIYFYINPFFPWSTPPLLRKPLFFFFFGHFLVLCLDPLRFPR